MVKLSSKLFLLSTDDRLHSLASTAFMRMLRQENLARVPDFAGQRVRQASSSKWSTASRRGWSLDLLHS
jgi:hypothetical protein